MQQNIGEQIQTSIKPITNVINDTVTNVSGVVNNTVDNISNATTNIRQTIGNTLSDFSSKEAVVNASNDFLQSNSIIAKFAFVILILILFVFFFSLGVKLLGFLMDMNKSPYLVKGIINGSNSLVISQDPRSSSSVTLQRSNNNKTGIEFTWSVWLLIAGGGSSTTTYSHIFNKGDMKWETTTGISSVNNGPGLYLLNTKPDLALRIVMDTENTPDTPYPPSESSKTFSTIDISNIPLNKWFNVCIRMQNVVMDVYINGTNSGRVVLPYVPRQNYNDVNICQNGGFTGNLSDLRYFDYALSAFDINTIVWRGPTLKTSNLGSTQYSNTTNYISNSWYFSKM
jgi:hypothetical protein